MTRRKTEETTRPENPEQERYLHGSCREQEKIETD